MICVRRSHTRLAAHLFDYCHGTAHVLAYIYVNANIALFPFAICLKYRVPAFRSMVIGTGLRRAVK